MPNKICPKCSISKHVRVAICDCGHQFYAKKGEIKQESQIKTTEKFSLIKAINEEKQVKEEPKLNVVSTFSKLLNKSQENPVLDDKYLNPGPGKKQCKNCQKYIGVRSETCPLCNFNFTSKEKTEIGHSKVEKTEIFTKKFDGPGKGRKECSKCHSFVGARTVECECGYNFESKILSKEVSKKLPFIEEKPNKGIIGLIAEVKEKQEKEEKKQKEKERGLVRFLTPGQGKKSCPSCVLRGDKLCYIPVATRVCDCGYVFEKKEKSEPFKREERKEDQFYKGIYAFGNQTFPLRYNLNYNDKDYQLIVNQVNKNNQTEIDHILLQEIDEYLITNNKKLSKDIIQKLNLTTQEIVQNVLKRKYLTVNFEEYNKVKKLQWIYSHPEIIVESIKEHFGTEYDINWSYR